jgi:hypothetical protein
LVLLVLLVAALAEPFWTQTASSRRTIVMLVDVSASMSGMDVAPSRFDAMQGEARKITAGLQPGERMAILAVGSTIFTACGFTDRPDQLLQAIDSLTPTDGTTSMPQAIRLARRLLAGKSNSHLVLLTDGAFPAAAELAGANHIHVTVLRGEARNAAITSLAARPQLADPGVYDVLVEVANYADQTLACELRVGLQGGPEQSTDVRIEPGQVQQVVLPLIVSGDGLLQARLTTEDDLASDNRACTLVRHRQRPHVLFITGGSTAADRSLQAALEADPRWDVSQHTELPAALPDRPIVVFHRNVPERLPSCPTLVIKPQDACELWEVVGVIEGPQAAVDRVAAESPLLARVRFEDFVVEQAVQLSFPQPPESLVASRSGESLVTLFRRPAADVLVLHVNLQREKSDLTMRPDFPMMIANAVAWLSRNEQPATSSATTGDTVAVTPSDQPRELKTADGETSQLQSQQELAVLDRVGVWTLPDDSGDVQLPVNLFSRDESDLRAGADLSSVGLDSPSRARQPLWMLLAFSALVGLVVESCLFHRRIVV